MTKYFKSTEKMKFYLYNLKVFLFCYLIAINFGGVSAQEPDIYAILVCTSKYWFNYRQSTNIMLIYHKLKEYGIPDNNVYIQ